MKKTLLKTSSVILLLFFITITFTSCEKEKNTIELIKVVNSSGQTMSGVTVVLESTKHYSGDRPNRKPKKKQELLTRREGFFYI